MDHDTRNHATFANTLMEDFIKHITGHGQQRVKTKNPENLFFVGKLSPSYEKNSDLTSATMVVQIGVDFVLKRSDINNAKVLVNPQGNLYYRVYPTLDEQRQFFIDQVNKEINDNKISNFNGLLQYIKEKDEYPKHEVVPVYVSVGLGTFSHSFELGQFFDEKKGRGRAEAHKEIKTFLDNVIEGIENAPDFYKIVREKVQIEDLADESSWQRFLQTKAKEQIKLKGVWELNLQCDVRPFGPDYVRVSINLINDSKTETYKNDSRINTLFNSGLHIELQGASFVPIPLDYFKDDYKYDRETYAIPFNCSVDLIEPNQIQTTHLPLYKQYRLKTNDKYKAPFQDLIDDPLTILKTIEKGMHRELKTWEKKAEDLSGNARKQIDEEVAAFNFEIQRFHNGIHLIENLDDVRDAFSLMNQTFQRASKGYSEWRLFQIVFIVSIIPDIVSAHYGEEGLGFPTYLERLDLLYYPTGGGKTEAFFGLLVFTLFFDRFRGKSTGVTAMIKYPLRLLSIQQVERQALVLASAEIIRREHPDIMESDCFSLGYLVGENNTPNRLTADQIKFLQKLTQKEVNEKYQILERCPFCGSTNVQVRLLEDEVRLVHECLEPGCASQGVLPFYMVDREIYRYLPSVIVGTLDKLAAIGLQSDYRNLFGELTFRCPVHGYSSKKNCTEREFCKASSDQFVDASNLLDPAPTLFIQDELHLVRESLGVYNAHYEGLLDFFMKELIKTPKKAKYIGASATISGFEEQAYHLYLKQAIRFPCDSPFLDHNFYSRIDSNEVNRLILGFAPFGKAIINSVVYSMKYMKKILWHYYTHPDEVMAIKGMSLNTQEEALQIIEDYWIMLQYNNVKLDGNNVIQALEGVINNELKLEGSQLFEIRKMTGDDTFQDVRKILAEVETTTDVFGGFNAIAATSMISHGVDAERFNLMFFFGMPNNTAEYVQAYSRVGRRFPGLVFIIMRPSRERDQSYLKHFIKFHEYKDILVEPVPINRWATRAVERTFPGILSAMFLNYFDFELQYGFGNIYMMKQLKEAIVNKVIDREIITGYIRMAYGCHLEDKGRLYDEYIEAKVNEFYDKISNQDFAKSDYITRGFERLRFLTPMTSLRDTDIPVTIEVK